MASPNSSATMQTEPAIPPIISDWQCQGLTPIAAGERIETLDVLRGFALLGILAVNMNLFAWPVYEVIVSGKDWTAPQDIAVDWIVRLLAEGKFYLLFSCLFGMGMAIQMERAAARGAAFAGRFCRRLLGLLGIGLFHAFVLWEGDILVSYAVFGFLLLAFRKCKPRTLLIWAAILLLVPVGLCVLFWGMITIGSVVPAGAEAIKQEFARADQYYDQMAAANKEAFARGSLAEIFAQRARNVLFIWQYTWFYAPNFFAMFLLGLYAGKRRLLQDLEANAGFFRRLLVWGLCLGLPANLLYAVCFESANPSRMDFLWVVAMAAHALGGPALCLAYVAGFTLLLRRGLWAQRLLPVAAAGRMALSNYLLQSLVCTTIFYSYGLGRYGSLGRAAGLGLVVIIYAAQIPFSVRWLKRFRFGPAEWLWRSITYGKLQPMRV
jgi:uncharacterized protein